MRLSQSYKCGFCKAPTGYVTVKVGSQVDGLPSYVMLLTGGKPGTKKSSESKAKITDIKGRLKEQFDIFGKFTLSLCHWDRHHSNVCTINMKLQPAASKISLAQRIRTGKQLAWLYPQLTEPTIGPVQIKMTRQGETCNYLQCAILQCSKNLPVHVNATRWDGVSSLSNNCLYYRSDLQLFRLILRLNITCSFLKHEWG